MEYNQFSVMRETQKALSRMKDTVAKNDEHSVSLKGLSPDQAEAVATTISLARSLALMSRLPEAVHESGIALKIVTGSMSSHRLSVEKGEPVAHFPIVPRGFIDITDKSALPVYQVEKALPLIAQSSFIPKGHWGTMQADMDNNGTTKDAAMLLSANKEIAVINAKLLGKVMKAHGFDPDKTVCTCLEGIEVKQNVESATSHEAMPKSNYASVLVEKNAYLQVLARENTRHRDGP